YLLAHAGSAAALSADDFLVSLRGTLDSDPLAVLAAEQRIAWMGLERYEALREQIAITVGEHLHYGVVHYWLALAEHALGQPEMALGRLARAESPAQTLYAFLDERVALRRERWLRGWDTTTPPNVITSAPADATPRALLDMLRSADLVVSDGPVL